MRQTKPFTLKPVWRNHLNDRYYRDMKQTMGWFSCLWKHPVRHRCLIRLFKIFIVLILLIICVLNVKLAIEAKLRYEQHQFLFSNLEELVVDNSDVYEYQHELNHRSHLHHDLELEIVSSQNYVELTVNTKTVFQSDDAEAHRGIFVFSLNQFSGAVMATRLYDTYTEGEDAALRDFLNEIKDEKRILILAVKDEASFNLKKETRDLLKAYGSEHINELSWRSMWAIITNKKGELIAEDLKISTDTSHWAEPVKLHVFVEPTVETRPINCQWPLSPENARRKEFCTKFDGYGSLCSCENSNALLLRNTEVPNNLAFNIPVAVIASNRPQYLYRMLNSLLSATGANPDIVTVFIDGNFEEPKEVAKLMGVKGVYHTPSGIRNARISQNYRSSLSAIFALNPSAKYAIILEEDLDVSPDIFHYFSQTLPLMEADPSIYCISAWNDQGYEHSCQNPSQLYRVETFPGLGWLLSRKIFKEELEPHWPAFDKSWDWDMWMRQPSIQKSRECIIPDVSRTFHFGVSGVNMNTYFHHLYFSRHKINKVPDVVLHNVDSLTKDNYEKEMHLLVREAVLVDHGKSPCDKGFIPVNSADSDFFVAYISMDSASQSSVFLHIFNCMKIWDLDVRGLHKSSFRTYINKRHVVMVGYPISPYSIYKPINVNPIKIIVEKQN